MNYFQTTKPPYECNVEIDADWLTQPVAGWEQQKQMIGSEWQPQTTPALHSRIAEMGRNAGSFLLGLVAFSGVAFVSSLAIAERSGDLTQVRGNSLETARNASMILGVGAAGGVVWLRNRKG